MTAQELTEAEAATLARFEAAPAAPESFDPIAALRRVEELAEEFRYKGEYGWGPWQAGEGPDIEGQILDEVASRIRATLAPRADDGTQGIWLR